jgi:hypothetical protein
MIQGRCDRLILLMAAFAAAAGLTVLRLFDPAISRIFPPCPVYALTGWYCPGCGSLRALHQLLSGNLRAAFGMNPFAVLSLPFLGYGVASYASFQIRGRYLPRWFMPPSWIWALCAAIVAFGVLRNFPQYPFSLMAPNAILQP